MKNHPIKSALFNASESLASLPIAAHTPGPWTPVSNRVYHDFPDGSRFVASCEVHKDYTPFLEQCANARLIAAAPELLAALQWSWGIVNDYWHANTTEEKNYYAQDMQHALDTMHKAIAKATQP